MGLLGLAGALTLVTGVTLAIVLGSRGASASAYDRNAFVLTLSGNDADCAISSQVFDLPFGGTMTIDVDWGDGSTDHYDTGASPSHQYSSNGSRTVTVTGSAQSFGSPATDIYGSGCVRTLEQWGSLGLTDLAGAFRHDSSLTSVPATIPAGVTDLHNAFDHATSFNGDLSGWDTRAVTNFHETFFGASSFNTPLPWLTASALDMGGMFRDAVAFDQAISSWNTDAVRDFSRMFEGARSFNHSIGGWYAWAGLDFSAMFRGATSYNQNWWAFNNQNSGSTAWMYAGATSYDQPTKISDAWHNASNLSHMFDGATAFNSRVSGNANNVQDLSYMFVDATSYNQPWDIDCAGAYNAEGMFMNATSFNSQITGSFRGLRFAKSMFEGATSMVDPFATSTLYMDFPYDTSRMFYGATKFDGSFGRMNMIYLVLADDMFHGASSFTGRGADGWRFASVTSANGMFEDASAFNADLGLAVFPSLVSARRMFFGASSFGRGHGGGVQTWYMNNLQDATSMFQGATSFDGDVTNWDVSGLQRAASMFAGAVSFDRSLANWNIVNLRADDGLGLGIGMSTANYSLSLNGWSTRAFANATTIAADGVRYLSSASFARDALIGQGLTVMDAGVQGTAPFAMSYDFQPFASDIAAMNGLVPVVVPIVGAVGVTVNWGDGTIEPVVDGAVPTHVYDLNTSIAQAPQVQVTGAIRGIDATLCVLSNSCRFIASFDQWGDTGIVSFDHAFSGLDHLNSVPTSIPSTVRTFAHLLDNNHGIDAVAMTAIAGWDTSNIVDMSFAFSGVGVAIPTLVWNTSNVLTMEGMFHGSTVVGALDLSAWDVHNVRSMAAMFRNSTFSGSIANWSTPNLTSMVLMFDGATLFNAPVNHLDVSHVLDLSYVFRDATAFNQPVSNWNVANVTRADGTFVRAGVFNQSLASWNLTHLVHADDMLSNSAISATNLDAFILDLYSRPQPTGVAIGATGLTYDPTHEVRNALAWLSNRNLTLNGAVAGTFTSTSPLQLVVDPGTSACGMTWLNLAMSDNYGITVAWGDGTSDSYTRGQWPWHDYGNTDPHIISVTGSLDTWGNRENWTNGSGCITDVLSFGDVGLWSLSGAFNGMSLRSLPTDIPSTVTDLSYAFAGAPTIPSQVSTWHTGNVTTLFATFVGSGGDPAIGNWDTHSVTSMQSTFQNTSNFDHPIGGWDVSHVTTMRGMFAGSAKFDQDISTWNPRSVGDMTDIFNGSVKFNHPIGSWNVSNVTTLEQAFTNSVAFDQSLAGWNTRNVTNLRNTFAGAQAFNGDLNTWDTSSVTNMECTFCGTQKFNKPLDGWNVTAVTNATNLFNNAAKFNQDLPHWRLDSATGVSAMFYRAPSFNGDLSGWRFPASHDLTYFFYGATAFNRDLSTWDVSTITSMNGTFAAASSFNGDVTTWDVRSLSYAGALFNGASSFNQDLSHWHLDHATNTSGMFQYASAFDQDMGSWHLGGLSWGDAMLDHAGLSPRHYSDTLIGWAAQVASGTMSSGVFLRSYPLTYLPYAASARQSLIDAGWNLGDGGPTDLSPMTIGWDPTSTSCGTTDVELAITNWADGTLDWGDGSPVETLTTVGLRTHHYATADAHTIGLSGDIRGFGDGAIHAGHDCFTSVGTWGGVRLRTMPGAFRGWSHLTYVPQSLGGVTDFSSMFRDASAFSEDLYWDLSGATTTAHMFDGATAFNGWTDGWGLPNVTDASYMFHDAVAFNRRTNGFNLPRATTIAHMFEGARSYAGDFYGWDVRNVRDLSHAFDGASNMWSLPTDWTLSSATDATDAFNGVPWRTLEYEQLLTAWAPKTLSSNLSIGFGGVTYRLAAAGAAHDHLVNDLHWTITDGGVQGTRPMTLTIDTSIASCNPSFLLPIYGVQDVDIDWGDGSALEHRSNGWNSPWHNFAHDSGTHTITISGLFDAYGRGDQYTWGSECIISVGSFGDIPLKLLDGAFTYTPYLTSMPATLPSTVTSLNYAFLNSGLVDGGIGTWDVSHVTTMVNTFNSAARFNGDISNWNTSSVTDLSSTFFNARVFDRDLSRWNTSHATTMVSTFEGAWSFNGDLSTWNTSNVSRMDAMFHDARTFNRDISAWDVSHLTRANDMFANAVRFNADISGWDVSSTTGDGLVRMFSGASSFDRNLGSWNFIHDTYMSDFLTNSGMSPRSYADTLKGWAANPALSSGVYFTAWGLHYRADAQSARDHLVNDRSWSIGDYGTWDLSPLQISYDPTTTSCGSSTVELALGGYVEATIDWGDGSTDPANAATTYSHTYSDTSAHTIAISGQAARFGDGVTHLGRQCFTQVTTWGHLGLTDVPGAFRGWTNLTRVPAWGLDGIRDFSNTFRDASSFNGEIFWDMSQVTTTSHMFDGATSFNGWTDGWTLNNDIDPTYMFRGASSFNRGTHRFGLRSATSIAHMFEGASSYGGYFDDWDVSHISDFSHAFDGATRMFTTPINWNLSAATDMTDAFKGVGWSTWSYENLLNAWAQSTMPSNLPVGFGSFTYRAAVAGAAHDHFVNDLHWTIADGGLQGTRPMTMTVDSNLFAGGDRWFRLNLHESYGVDIDWGDGTDHTVLGVGGGYPHHEYITNGQYTITMSGLADGFGNHDGGRGGEIVTGITSFGDLGLMYLDGAFSRQPNLVAAPTELPSRVRNLDYLAAWNPNFSADLSGWDTSNVTSMVATFAGSPKFNGNVSTWNTSNVTDMHAMFDSAYAFNGDLSAWNTSNVTNMQSMFSAAFAFNGDVSTWNVSKVTNFVNMFTSAQAFNRDLSHWNTSSATNTSWMFYDAISFNGDVSTWNMSNVTDISAMFRGAYAFNSDISNWNVSKVRWMDDTFRETRVFDQDLNRWDVSSVTTANGLHGTFYSASGFNHSIGNWRISTPYMNEMLAGAGMKAAAYSDTLIGWAANPDTPHNVVATFSGMRWLPSAHAARDHLVYDLGWYLADDAPRDMTPTKIVWDPSTGCASDQATLTFSGYVSISVDWGDGGDAQAVTTAGSTTHTYTDTAHAHTISLTGDITGLGDGQAHTGTGCFTRVDQWGATYISRLPGAFRGWSNLVYVPNDAPGALYDLSNTFRDAVRFNSNINGWSWNVNPVTTFAHMFDGATSFNGWLWDWNPGSATTYEAMFRNATSFTAPVGRWNVGNSRSFASMFEGATSFNGDVAGFDVHNATTFAHMFDGASSANPDLTRWQPTSLTDATAMFSGSALGTWNYSKLLEAWSPLALQHGVTFDAPDSKYMASSVAARASLVTDLGWLIADGGLAGSAPMTITVDTSLLPDWDHWFMLPIAGVTTATVDWGDGTGPETLGYGTRFVNHEFNDAPGPHTISIYGLATNYGWHDGIRNGQIVTGITSFGDLELVSLDGAFAHNQPNLNVVPSTLPSSVRVLDYLVYNRAGFTGDLSGWDTSHVTSMQGAFQSSDFHGDISSWNTSHVVNMGGLFFQDSLFNTDISAWDVHNVTTMESMFSGASSFNRDISGWNPVHLTSAPYMFRSATSFNQPIGVWHTDSLVDMRSMFENATAFNQSLAGWNTSHVTDMSGLFLDAISFNGDISTWDVRNVAYMNDTFRNARAFNSDISRWNTSSLQQLRRTFEATRAFNADIGHWNTSNLSDVWRAFDDASAFDHSLGAWDVHNIGAFNETFDYGHISARAWSDTLVGWASQVVSLRWWVGVSAYGQTYLPYAVDARNTLASIGWAIYDSGAKDLSPMQVVYDSSTTSCGTGTVELALSGTVDVDVVWGDDSATEHYSSAGVISHTFADGVTSSTIAISGDLRGFGDGMEHLGRSCFTNVTTWGRLGLTSLRGAFYGWDHLVAIPSIAGITDFTNTFRDATAFNQDLVWLDMGAATTTAHMFDGATSFNGWVDGWNMSNVADASYMFRGATSFNRYVGNWSVQRMATVSHMFEGATSFNSDLGYWFRDGSAITDLSSMFRGATSFNGWVDGWHVERVTNFDHFADGATSFNRDLRTWDITAATSMVGMLDGSGMSVGNYSYVLFTWGTQAVRSNVTFGASGLQYASIGNDHRARLVNDLGWTITGDASLGSNPMVIHVDTRSASCDPNFQLPLRGITYADIDWGDGTTSHVENTDSPWHGYPGDARGTYEVKVTGLADRYGHEYGAYSRYCITGISSFGDLGLTSLQGAMASYPYVTTDVPATLPTTVRNLSQALNSMPNFTGDVSGWDVSRVTSLYATFSSSTAFNGDLSRWDVGNVTDMTSVFTNATAFNGDISGWNTSKATVMASMFYGASSFDRDLSRWNVGRVTSMSSMFWGATNFNGDVSTWDVSHVQDMSYMFRETGRFNSDISRWNTANVGNMYSMFYGALAFDQDIARWSLSSIGGGGLNYFLTYASSFNHSLGALDLSRIYGLDETLTGSGMRPKVYSDTLAGWLANPRTPNGIRLVAWGLRTNADGAIARSGLTDGKGWIIYDYGARDLTPMQIVWDPSTGCASDRATVSVGGYLDASIDWGDATDPQAITTAGDLTHTYADPTAAHTISISGDVGAFGRADGTPNVNCFTQVPQWGALWTTKLAGAFRGWTNLVSVPNYIPGGVTDLTNVFRGATHFNSYIQDWDVSRAVSLAGAFQGATSFNQNLWGWSPYSATDMSHMFDGATSFNQNIARWPMNNVVTVDWMFAGASSFNFDIGGLDVSHVRTMAHMFDGTALNTVNYSAIIANWSAQNVRHGVTLGALGAKYRESVAAAHAHLVDDLGWTINDAGQAGSQPLVVDVSFTTCGNGWYQLPIHDTYDYVVDWGDGTSDSYGPGTNFPTHHFPTGDFTVRVSGFANSFGYDGGLYGDNCVRGISSFGDLDLVNLDGALANHPLLTNEFPATLPATARSTRYMFGGSSAFNGDISGWDVSRVNNMDSMFVNALAFNGDLSNWNVSSVQSMNAMFANAASFNGDIARWNVGNVTNMESMFWRATAFDRDLSHWNVSHVTNMNSMFNSAPLFNADLSTWDVSHVVTMNSMFRDARRFNADIGGWNVSSISGNGLAEMFYGASTFDHSLGSWNFPNMGNYMGAFLAWTGMHSKAYDATLSGWAANPSTPNNVYMDAEGVQYTPAGAAAYAHLQDDKGWRIQDWGLRTFSPMSISYSAGDISCDATTAQLALSNYVDVDVDWGDGSPVVHASAAGTVSHTYAPGTNATINLTGDLTGFGNGQAISGTNCYTQVTSFGNVGLTSLAGAFRGWSNLVAVPNYIGGVSDLSNTFRDATRFNQDIGWNLDSAVTTAHMFDGATSFNGWVDGLNTRTVSDMSWMFHGATSFNRNVGDLPTSSVTTTAHMFDGATSFNQDLSNWNLSRLVDATSMFQGATSFNGGVEYWYTPLLAVTAHMFDGASNFDRNVQNWIVTSLTDATDMFTGSHFGPGNYSRLLDNWSTQAVQHGVVFGAGAARYHTTLGAFTYGGRDHLVNDMEWVITDGGSMSGAPLVVTVDTNTPGFDGNFYLPVNSTVEIAADWGDGTTIEYSGANNNSLYHYYAPGSGSFTMSISGIAYGYGSTDFVSSAAIITSISSFGDLGITSLHAAFANTQRITTGVPSTIPSTVTDLSQAFLGSHVTTPDLSGWDVSHVTNMFQMARNASSFDAAVGSWTTTSLTTMESVFEGATVFNQDLTHWNTTHVTTMLAAFHDAIQFNGDVSGFDTSAVTTFDAMFTNAPGFRGDISRWNTHNARSMRGMFLNARSFDSDVSGFDLSSIDGDGLVQMFQGDWAFDHSLGNWNLSRVTNAHDMLTGSGMRARAYSDSLEGWAANPATAHSIDLTAYHVRYYPSAQPAHDHLVADLGWSLGDQGQIGVTPMVVDYSTAAAGCSATDVELAFSGYTDVDIDWGDGTTPQHVAAPGVVSHTLAPGTTTGSIRLSGELVGFGDGAQHLGRSCFTNVSTWGDLKPSALNGAFYGWNHLTAVPADSPGYVTDLRSTFRGASSLGDGPLFWDVSAVTSMAHTFDGASSFNGYMNWYTPNVTDMSWTFHDATSFRGDLSNWNTTSVRTMSHMFDGATSADINVSPWNVANVTDMSSMFRGDVAFGGWLASWNVSRVTDMSHMFDGASRFTGDLANWTPLALADATSILDGSALTIWNYTRLIESWGAQAVPSSVSLGVGATLYASMATVAHDHLTSDLGWTIADGGVLGGAPMVVHLDLSAPGCDASQAITIPVRGVHYAEIDWNDGSQIQILADGAPMADHVYGAAGSYSVSITGVVDGYGYASGLDRGPCFTGIGSFGEIGLMDLDGAMSSMSNITTDVPATLPSTVRSLSRVFYNSPNVNGDVSGWDTSNVTTMFGAFWSAPSFTGDLSSWNTAKVSDFGAMFDGATHFDSDISGWNTSSATSMNAMFGHTQAFNRSLARWDVSKVTDMRRMFTDSTSFNGDVSGWHTSKLLDASMMFFNATAFDQPVANFDVSHVSNFSAMFSGATAFDQSLGSWTIPNDTYVGDGAFCGGISLANWTASIIGWADHRAPSVRVVIDGCGHKYRKAALASWTKLHDTAGWNIQSDGGLYTTAPDAPASLAATVANHGATFDWAVPFDGDSPILRYDATVSDTGAATVATCRQDDPTVVHCSVTGLVDGDTYSAIVTATNATGTSVASTPVSFMPVGPPTAPAAPGVTGVANTATITWIAPRSGGSAITGYTVSARVNGSEVATCAPASVATTSCSIPNLAYGRDHTFVVKATNAAGSSGWSDPTVASFGAIPTAPTGAHGTGGDRSIAAAWNAVTATPAVTSYTATAYDGANVAGSCTTANGSTTDCTISNLTNGTVYTVKVVATNLIGASDASAASSTIQVGVVPTAPSGVAGTGGDRTIAVRWNAVTAAPAVTSYTATAYSGLSQAGSCVVNAPSLTCTISGLTNGTSYSLKVKATNAMGTGGESSAATVSAGGAPAAPLTVSGTGGDRTIVAQWSAVTASPALTSYTATAYNGANPAGSCTTANGTTTTCTISNLTNGTSYTVKVKATNSLGTGVESNSSTSILVGVVPAAPTNGVPTGGVGQVVAHWSAVTAAPAVTSYTATAYSGATPAGSCTTADGSTLTCAISGLTNGTSYTVKVRATNAIGTGSESTASAAVVVGALPGTPTGLTGTSGAGQITANWTAVMATPAVTSYTVTAYNGATDAGHCTTANGTTVTCAITGLTNGQAYTLKVLATNAVGASPQSAATGSVTPLAAPGAPTAIAAERGAAAVRVSWTAPASNGGAPIDKYTVLTYKAGVLVTAATCSTTATAPAVPATNCVVSGLTNGTAYTFKVKAHNAKGDTTDALNATPAVTPVAAPAMMAQPTVTRGDKSITVVWKAPATNGKPITGYTLVVLKADGTAATGVVCPTKIGRTSLNATCTGASNTTEYIVKVKATNANGDGLFSEPVKLVAATVPGAPTGLKATSGAVNSKKVTLAWTAPTSTGGLPITGYDIYVNGKLAFSNITATTYVATMTKTGTYTYTVVAKNVMGTSSASAAVSGVAK